MNCSFVISTLAQSFQMLSFGWNHEHKTFLKQRHLFRFVLRVQIECIRDEESEFFYLFLKKCSPEDHWFSCSLSFSNNTFCNSKNLFHSSHGINLRLASCLACIYLNRNFFNVNCSFNSNVPNTKTVNAHGNIQTVIFKEILQDLFISTLRQIHNLEVQLIHWWNC